MTTAARANAVASVGAGEKFRTSGIPTPTTWPSVRSDVTRTVRVAAARVGAAVVTGVATRAVVPAGTVEDPAAEGAVWARSADRSPEPAEQAAGAATARTAAPPSMIVRVRDTIVRRVVGSGVSLEVRTKRGRASGRRGCLPDGSDEVTAPSAAGGTLYVAYLPTAAGRVHRSRSRRSGMAQGDAPRGTGANPGADTDTPPDLYSSTVVAPAQIALGVVSAAAVVAVLLALDGGLWPFAVLAVLLVAGATYFVASMTVSIDSAHLVVAQGRRDNDERIIPIDDITAVEPRVLTWQEAFGIGIESDDLTTRLTLRAGPALFVSLISGEEVRLSTGDPHAAMAALGRTPAPAVSPVPVTIDPPAPAVAAYAAAPRPAVAPTRPGRRSNRWTRRTRVRRRCRPPRRAPRCPGPPRRLPPRRRPRPPACRPRRRPPPCRPRRRPPPAPRRRPRRRGRGPVRGPDRAAPAGR